MEEHTLETKADNAVTAIQDAVNALILRIEELEKENAELREQLKSRLLEKGVVLS